MTRHTLISFVKSGLRLFGYITLGVVYTELIPGMLILSIAEILGIAEEIGAKYE